MKRTEIEFTDTPAALDEMIAKKRDEGFIVKVKRVADLDDGKRKYKVRLTPKPSNEG